MKSEDLKSFAPDLDGVIADTARSHGQAWHQLADKVETEWTPELTDALRGVSRMNSLELTSKAGGHGNDYTQEEKEALATEKNDNYIKLVETLTPADILPGMKDFLNELKANGYHIVLASASENAPKVLKYLQLTDHFEGIVNPANLSHGKPDPEIYQETAKLMDPPADQVAGLEDTQAGIESINRVGELLIGFGADSQDADAKSDKTGDVSLVAIKAQVN